MAVPATFLQRWSQRKAAAASEPDATCPEDEPREEIATEPQAQPEPAQHESGPAGSAVQADFATPGQALLAEGVDLAVQIAGLRRLWASDPIFSTSDGLDVYCADYTCAACPDPANDVRAVADEAARIAEQLAEDPGNSKPPGDAPGEA